MLYHLLYPLRDIFFGFNVFRYITFRAGMSSLTAFLITFCIGPLVIRKLAQYGIGQSVRSDEECPGLYTLHKDKAGTPTMGGILIIMSIIMSTLLWADLTNMFVQAVIFTTAWLGILGFIDDYLKVKKNKSKGLTARIKLIGQIVLGLMIGLFVYYNPGLSRHLDLPFFKNIIINLGAWYILFSVLVVVGSSNAVNLTDGLDGLAAGCVTLVALTYGVMSYITGHMNFSNYLNVPYVPGSGELVIICMAMAGAGLGFLWFNCYPARVFMGDTGALALGGAIGVISLFIKKEILLVLVGGIFVVETMSVILQTTSYRLRKKRIFKVAPIHHHYQLKGWTETQVTVRFWIIAAILALLGLCTLKLR
ncbi:MAG: phospho-N-acetylmuramoyl-pentapeptide-transferase [Candidatus Omnitrophica bacterium]|nr:phospho-N-acetylmuramoyl-pentapeptide-transferase [Candidatus Omnitrophota bacterium]